MTQFPTSDPIEFRNDPDAATAVMREAGQWLLDSGKKPGIWWLPETLNVDGLADFARPEEFFAGFVNDEPAVGCILQTEQTAQDWSFVDRGETPPALYVHWLAVSRRFAGKGMPAALIDFARRRAQELKVERLRLDANAAEPKLRRIYEDLGFEVVALLKEDEVETVLYESFVEPQG